MKKIFKAGISLLLVSIMCSFIFVSCGDNSSAGGGAIQGEEVTREEWIKAFDITRLSEFTFKFSDGGQYMDGSTKIEGTTSGTLTYKNGHWQSNWTETWIYDGEVDVDSGSDEMDEYFESILDISDAVWSELFGELMDTLIRVGGVDFYCYSQFEYSSSKGAYTATIIDSTDDYNWEYNVSIWFKDGHIVKIVSAGQNLDDETDFDYGTYEFFDIK